MGFGNLLPTKKQWISLQPFPPLRLAAAISFIPICESAVLIEFCSFLSVFSRQQKLRLLLGWKQGIDGTNMMDTL